MKVNINAPDIYFLPEWGELYQERDQGEVGIFDFENDFGHVYYQFIKRRVPNELSTHPYFDTVTPYGFCGPLIIDYALDKRDLLVSAWDEAFQKYCLRENIVAEYIRFNPWLMNHSDFKNIYTLKYNNYTIYTDLTVADIFMEEFNSKTRNQIRKAIRSGVQCQFDFNGSSIKEFNRLIQLTIKKNNVDEYHLFKPDFLLKTFQVLKGKQFIINAFFEGKCISSAIFLHHGENVHYYLAANDPQYYPLNANSLILHEACSWGKNNHKKKLHLGGAYSEKLFAFKKQFTKNGICDYYIGEKARNEKVYQELVDIKKKKGTISNMEYYPLYRG